VNANLDTVIRLTDDRPSCEEVTRFGCGTAEVRDAFWAAPCNLLCGALVEACNVSAVN
jgi:hypothetical protein